VYTKVPKNILLPVSSRSK